MTVDFDRLHDKLYRLNNLYRIIDKSGSSVPFKLNPVQNDVFKCRTNRNLILKARQLGMSTFAVLYMLDEVLFRRNYSAGIVSYSLPHAQHIFKNIVGHALDHFPPELQPIGEIGRSTRELRLENGSDFRVDTSLRGGTTQAVLISEFGKTCARSPIRADEIITGTLESVPVNGEIWIESTGEGTSGPFTEMCLAANARGNDDLGSMDYKLHFFPWFTEEQYRLSETVKFDVKLNDYFHSLEAQGIKLDLEQKKWYAKKAFILGDKVQQEYPSTVAEAFVSNAEAFYFAKLLQDAKAEERIVDHDLYDALLPVYVAADIGVTDRTVFTFFQYHQGEPRIIDSYADTNRGLDFYANFLLKEKPYIYDTIYLPHDAARKDNIIVENTYESEFRKLVKHTGTKVKVLPRTDRNASIGNAIAKLPRCVFSSRRCSDYIQHLMKYRKRWNESLGRYIDEPYHDEHSDFGDSFRYAMQAISIIERTGSGTNAMEKHREAIDARYSLI